MTSCLDDIHSACLFDYNVVVGDTADAVLKSRGEDDTGDYRHALRLMLKCHFIRWYF